MLHLCYSVPAVHSRHIHSSQHNEPETSKRRLRGREREEDRGEGGRQKRKKQPRKKARKKRRTPKIPVFPLLFSLCHYSVIFPAEWASIIFSSQDINHFNLGTQKLQWFLIKKNKHIFTYATEHFWPSSQQLPNSFYSVPVEVSIPIRHSINTIMQKQQKFCFFKSVEK